MAKQNTKVKRGFTIIEVVLVLAIAGLIFLMVFVAWPALQRTQKDTQRRNDYAMLSTAISSFSTNNNNRLANILNGKTRNSLDPSKYINETGKDPDGYDYVLEAVDCNAEDCTALDVTNKKVYVAVHADCSGVKDESSAPKANASSRAFAIYGYLEGGNGSYCSDSQ